MNDLIDFFELFESNELKKIKITEHFIQSEIDKKSFESDGMVYELLTNKKYLPYFEKTLLNEFSNEFLPLYFIKCIKYNPSSEWADSRFSAAWAAVGWFCDVHRAHRTTRENNTLNTFVKQLGTLYLNGDKKIKEAIIIGFLEHILYKKGMRRYFRDWYKSIELKQACDFALNKNVQIK